MLEKDMEELMTRCHSGFFRRNQFPLVSREGSVSGVGRSDLLFKGSRGLSILMEVKARPAKYADAEQLAKYSGLAQTDGRCTVGATSLPSAKRFLSCCRYIQHG